MYITLAKSWSMRRASHQSAFMDSCLTISQTFLPCLPSKRVILGVLYIPMVGLMVVPLMFLTHDECGLSSKGS